MPGASAMRHVGDAGPCRDRAERRCQRRGGEGRLPGGYRPPPGGCSIREQDVGPSSGTWPMGPAGSPRSAVVVPGRRSLKTTAAAERMAPENTAWRRAYTGRRWRTGIVPSTRSARAPWRRPLGRDGRRHALREHLNDLYRVRDPPVAGRACCAARWRRSTYVDHVLDAARELTAAVDAGGRVGRRVALRRLTLRRVALRRACGVRRREAPGRSAARR